jgi:hypothetical protein
MSNNRYQCHLCGQWYESYSDSGVREEPSCPACLNMLSHKRGSGRDKAQSHIQYGPCSRCGSETEYFNLSDGSHTLQCPQCSRTYSSSAY